MAQKPPNKSQYDSETTTSPAKRPERVPTHVRTRTMPVKEGIQLQPPDTKPYLINGSGSDSGDEVEDNHGMFSIVSGQAEIMSPHFERDIPEEPAGTDSFNKLSNGEGTPDLEELKVTGQSSSLQPDMLIGMPNYGNTRTFPRRDTKYMMMDSIPYDEAEAIVWKQREHDDRAFDELRMWVAHAITGLVVGVTAFAMDRLEETLVAVNRGWAQDVIDHFGPKSIHSVYLPWLQYTAFCMLIGTCAGVMTTYYGPGAAGSGVAEMIGYLNGINYPNFIGVATLVTKIVGVVLAVSARLCIGKEGPLAHIGSIWGAAVPYLPGLGFEFMRNDHLKQSLIAGGASAGAAAAFGAPIGGALFSYELSKSSELQHFELIWRTFITCSFATLILDVLQTLAHGGNFEDLSAMHGSATKFGATRVD